MRRPHLSHRWSSSLCSRAASRLGPLQRVQLTPRRRGLREERKWRKLIAESPEDGGERKIARLLQGSAHSPPPAPRVGLHCGGNKGLGNWAVRIIVGERNLRGTRVPAQWHLRSLVGRGEHS